MAAVRLAKYLARCGVASRRASERLIADGRVTVAGAVMTDPALDVDEGTVVAVDGDPISPEEPEAWAVNKPPGVVSTARDTHGRRVVTELVHSERRLYPVGRLDADTTGLMLLTNDGDLAERLTHPRYGVEKTYRARIEPPDLAERHVDALRAGVELDDGPAAALGARLLGPGVVELTIAEGRKRQVRRMLDAVGHRVTALERIAFGPLRLDELGAGGRALRPGQSRLLDTEEVKRLHEAARWENPRP